MTTTKIGHIGFSSEIMMKNYSYNVDDCYIEHQITFITPGMEEYVVINKDHYNTLFALAKQKQNEHSFLKDQVEFQEAY